MDPRAKRQPGFREVREVVRPDAFLFEASEEALDKRILFRRIRGDELLAQPVVPTGGPKASALIDEPVAAAPVGVGPLGRSVPSGVRHTSSRARSTSRARPHS